MTEFGVFDERQNQAFVAMDPLFVRVDTGSLFSLESEQLNAVIHFHGVVPAEAVVLPADGWHLRTAPNCVNSAFTNNIVIADDSMPRIMEWYIVPPT
jgi:hypothetical protein